MEDNVRNVTGYRYNVGDSIKEKVNSFIKENDIHGNRLKLEDTDAGKYIIVTDCPLQMLGTVTEKVCRYHETEPEFFATANDTYVVYLSFSRKEFSNGLYSFKNGSLVRMQYIVPKNCYTCDYNCGYCTGYGFLNNGEESFGMSIEKISEENPDGCDNWNPKFNFYLEEMDCNKGYSKTHPAIFEVIGE